MTSGINRPGQYFVNENSPPGEGSSAKPHSALEAFGEVAAAKRLRLYIAEEQQILREAYQTFFLPHPTIEVVGASGDTSIESLVGAAATLKPTVMLLGFKVLHADTVDRLKEIRQVEPNTAIALLSASYDVKGIKALREFSRGASVGCAYLLKHTIDTVEQLTQVVQSVSEGRIILDPAVMEGFINSIDAKSTFLKDLSPRELEVLSWMAKGYNNHTIADVLCLEPKTIERHINGIYNKLGTTPDSKHARVHAVTLYLRATGALPAEDFAEAS
ncbi:MAG: response regulator transcription factor [Chloroflexi bacterium]|nr:response regulator transcription factor [Chloroflexota bacterium]MCH7655631.1 response regulator transcription factor [Chloroflexota bacterium]